MKVETLDLMTSALELFLQNCSYSVHPRCTPSLFLSVDAASALGIVNVCSAVAAYCGTTRQVCRWHKKRSLRSRSPGVPLAVFIMTHREPSELIETLNVEHVHPTVYLFRLLTSNTCEDRAPAPNPQVRLRPLSSTGTQ
jgi:hypothetical protein